MGRSVRDTVTVTPDGRLVLDHKERFLFQLRSLIGVTPLEIVIREPVSRGQRGYYFSTLLPAAAAAMGQDRRSTHEDLKAYIVGLGIMDAGTAQIHEMPGESFEDLGLDEFGHVLLELTALVRDWLGGDIP